jgi:Transcriptional regulator, AbiEi antitoxin
MTAFGSLKVVTAAELRTMQFEPMRWALPDYVAEESVTLLVGRPKIGKGGLDEIERWCASAAHPALVLIDTLARFRKPTDAKQQLYASDTEAMASLPKIAVKYHLAIVVGHHDRKAEADDDFDTVSGTLGLTGAADSVILLKRKPHGVILSVRGRDVEERETAVHFDKAKWRWTILGEASTVRRSVERSRVIAVMTEAGGLASVQQIMAEIKLRRNALDLLLGRMAKDGEIVRIGRGKYALPDQFAEPRQIGQKERRDGEAVSGVGTTPDLSNLSDLSEPDLAPGERVEV